MDRVGARIAQVRKAAGLTQAELAERIERSTNQVSNIERAGTDVPVSVIFSIAAALDVGAADLFDWAQSPNRNKADAERGKILSKVRSLLDDDKAVTVDDLRELIEALARKR